MAAAEARARQLGIELGVPVPQLDHQFLLAVRGQVRTGHGDGREKLPHPGLRTEIHADRASSTGREYRLHTCRSEPEAASRLRAAEQGDGYAAISGRERVLGHERIGVGTADDTRDAAFVDAELHEDTAARVRPVAR